MAGPGRTACLGACAAAESWCIKATAVGSAALLDGCALCTKISVSNATTHIKPLLVLRLRGRAHTLVATAGLLLAWPHHFVKQQHTEWFLGEKEGRSGPVARCMAQSSANPL